MEFLLYSWLEYEYPRLHGIRSYFNKIMKSLCYDDGVVNRSVFDAPDLPEEMLTVPPPEREQSPEEVILDLAMSVKRASTDLVSTIRKGWVIPQVKRLRGKELDRELESTLQNLSSSTEVIKEADSLSFDQGEEHSLEEQKSTSNHQKKRICSTNS